MPVLTITAVNTGANQLTITGHGLLSGDGPAAGRSIGGSLPAPLAAATDYWIIRDDANTIRLATSSANAMAGTAIDLTTAGSGTLLLEIGIPYRRARTYAPASGGVAGARVHSADLNALMDAWKALWALTTGQSQSVWTGLALVGPVWLRGSDGIANSNATITRSNTSSCTDPSGLRDRTSQRPPSV